MTAMETKKRTHAGTGTSDWSASMAMNVKNGRMYGTAGCRRNSGIVTVVNPPAETRV
jgi:hypothetical protein